MRNTSATSPATRPAPPSTRCRIENSIDRALANRSDITIICMHPLSGRLSCRPSKSATTWTVVTAPAGWYLRPALLLAIRQHLYDVLPDNLRRSCAIANYKQESLLLLPVTTP